MKEEMVPRARCTCALLVSYNVLLGVRPLSYTQPHLQVEPTAVVSDQYAKN